MGTDRHRPPDPATGEGEIPGGRVWQNGLIVERDGRVAGGGWPSPAHHNLISAESPAPQGEPLRVVAERVELRGHTLRWLLSRIDQSRPYFLLGEVEIPEGRGPALTGRLDSVDTYNPASYRGGILRLHYARAAELGPWLDLVASGARWWCSSGSGRARRQ